MTLTARTTLTRSLLATLALALAAAVAGCGSGPGSAHGAAAGGNSATGGSAGATTGSAGAATGGGSATGGSSPAGGVPAAARNLICPPVLTGGRLNPLLSQAIPAGFSAVAVVRCLPAGGIAPVRGQWTYVQKEAAVAGLGPLLTALRAPSARHSGAGVAPGCPVLAAVVPRLALIGRDGAVIYPRIPVTVCGAPVQAVLASLGALHWIGLGNPVGLQPVQPPGVQPPGVQPPGPGTPQTAALPGS